MIVPTASVLSRRFVHFQRVSSRSSARHVAQRIAVLLAIAIYVSACATSGFGGGQSERRAATLARNGDFDDAASAYIGLAATSSGAERDRLTLLAVEQWLFAGDGRRSRSALSQVVKPAGGELLWLWSADAAAFALWEGRPDQALSLLQPLSRQPLPAVHRARVEALRADAWFQKGEPLRAVDLYMQRENWLSDPVLIQENRERLWAGLQLADLKTLRNVAGITHDPTVRGWLSLAVLAKSTGQKGIGWGNGILRWQASYAGHPATDVLPDLSLSEDSLLNYPRQIALLLPDRKSVV